MKLLDVLKLSRQLGVQLYLKDEKLAVRAKKGTVRDDLLSDIKSLKDEIIRFLKTSDTTDSLQLPAIVPASGSDAWPLSFAQERLWFIEQMERGTTQFNITGEFELKGHLEHKTFEEAFDLLLQRQHALRTSFCVENGEVKQSVLKDYDLPITYSSLVDLPVEQQASVLAALATNENQLSFDLNHGPLLRVYVLSLNKSLHKVLYTTHHIVSDGWSIALFIREFLEIYDSLRSSRQPQLPELYVQYTDFAVWQRKYITNENLESQLNYWLEHLERMPKDHGIKLDNSRGKVQPHQGRLHRKMLSHDMTTKLICYCQTNSLTPFMVLQTVFALLLAKHSGETDFVMGLIVAGRTQRETESLIGLFVNSLVLRSRFTPSQTFQQCLAENKNVILDAYANQNVPFDLLVERLNPTRELNKNPLFQIMIIHIAEQNESINLSIATEEEASRLPLRTDLDLYIEETLNAEIKADFVFNDTIWTESTIALLAHQFEYILSQVLQNPDIFYDAIVLDPEPDSEFFKRYDHDCNDAALAIQCDRSLALSYHQQRLWFIDKFERNVLYHGSPSYHNIPLIIDFEGVIDHQRLQEAFNYVVSQHGVLRSLFREESDGMIQIGYAEEGGFLVEFESFSGHSLSESELIEKLLAETRVSFDFNQSCCFRAKLFQTDVRRYSLLIVFHHLIVDRESTLIFAEHLLNAYQHLFVLPTHDSTREVYPYQRFAHLQQDDTFSRFKAHFLYWSSKLKGNVKALELPTDRPRKAIHEYQAATATLSIDCDLAAIISASCQTYDYTEYDFFLTAFKALLFRYVVHEEIVVGIVGANRKSEHLGQAIGPFSNLLVTRDVLNLNDSFLEVAKKVKKTCNEARKYGAVPFDWLVRELSLKVDMSRTALFDVLFQYEVSRESLHAVTGEDYKASLQETNLGYGKYDLNLLVLRHQNHIEFKMCFNKDMFDFSTIDAMLQHFQRFIQAAAHRPSLQIGNVGILNAEEIKFQHSVCRQKVSGDAMQKCIHECFEQIVEDTPDAIALVFEDQFLSYKALNEKANQIAHYLRKKGVAADSLVGLCIDRSLDMLVGLLGILKAGGAYLPIDSSYPHSRIQFMLDDSGVQIILTQEELVMHLFADHPIQLLYVDSDKASSGETGIFSSQPVSNIPVGEIGLGASNLAYVIYTSGSTGQPKGVLVEHRNITRLFDTTHAQFEFRSSDKWTLFHSISFDFSVWEIWGALKFGGQLVIVPKWIAQSPRDFYKLVVDESITILNQTPSAFSQFIDVDLAEQKSLSLRAVIFGGEALKTQILAPWVDRHGDQCIHLVNMYGITETTVHVTYRRLFKQDILGTKPSVIGTPIADLQIYLLDKNLSFVPNGVIAEIYVTGAGLARGYHNRPELTDTRFINVLLSGECEQRLYKTGDLARRLKDGELEYIGRADEQVKIRGFRIELGEIEMQLSRHPAIKTCIVIVRKNVAGDQQLVAYVVINSSNKTSIESNLIQSLRLHLHANLPEYMIPDAYVELDYLPLTSNGKIDKQALPEPRLAAYSSDDYLPPSSRIESKLVELWAELLGHEKELLSCTANFFMLGGHSLIATRLFSDIRQAFGLELPLRTLFEAPTIAGLAEKIAESTEKVQIPPLTKTAPDAPKVLSFAQQRLWFIDQFGQGSVEYNSPGHQVVYGHVNVDAFRQAFHSLLIRHEVLRTVYLAKDGIAEPQVLTHFELPFTLIDLSYLTGPEQQNRLEKIKHDEATTLFSLTSDLMLRIRLAKLSDSEHHIFYTFHHIACDGWSNAIFNEELTTLYRVFSASLPNPLPPLDYQYSDFATWQRTWLRGDLLNKQIDFWRERLTGAPSVHRLPLDKPRPATLTCQGEVYTAYLPEQHAITVKQYCENNDITPFIFFYTAFSALLCRLSNSNDMVIGTPLSGRTHKSLEGMIGLFVNTLALRTYIEDDMDFLHLLAANKNLILDSFSHQDLPFDILVDEVCTERTVNHSPVFQIMFAMQNNESGQLNLNDQNTHQSNYFQSETPDTSFVEITTRFDIELHVGQDGNDFAFSWIFNTQLFDQETIVGFSSCLFSLIESVLSDIQSGDAVHRPLLSLPILNETNPFASINDCTESISYLLSHCAYSELAELTASAVHRSQLKVVVLNQALQIQPKGVAGNIGLLQCCSGIDGNLAVGDVNDKVNTGHFYPTRLQGRMSHTGELRLTHNDSYTRDIAKNNQSRVLQKIVYSFPTIAFCHIDISGDTLIGEDIVCYLCVSDENMSLNGQTQIKHNLIRLIREQRELCVIPDRFVFLESIPALYCGTPDVKALSQSLKLHAATERVLPRNGIEQFLCRLWVDLLEIGEVGVTDNFFALGGHSLLTTRLISAIRTEFDIEISIQSVFQTPTVEYIGTLISMQLDAKNIDENQSALERGEDEIEEGVF